MSLRTRLHGVHVCWLACEDEDTWPLDLHVGPQQVLDGSEDDVILLVTPAM